ncbi:MAG: hypothetical protein AAF699_08510 [Pseudomonadota bacterium]
MSTVNSVFRSADRSLVLPDLRIAHWLPRLLLAGVIFHQGIIKFPLAAAAAEGVGTSFWLYAMAALGQLAAGVALVVGGFSKLPFSDLLTRLGGLTVALVTFSVLVVVYNVFTLPLEVVWMANKVHLFLLAAGLYFAARGNAA